MSRGPVLARPLLLCLVMHKVSTWAWLAVLVGCQGSGTDTTTGDGGLATSDAGKHDAGTLDAGEDGGGSRTATLEACLSDLSEPESGFIGIQRFRSKDGKVSLARARQTIDAPTVGETLAYALVRFWIESDEEPGTCVRGKSALSYEYAHHNWNETWSAKSNVATYEGAEVFSPVDATARWSDTLSAKDKNGKLLWGPVELEEDGCTSIPYDLNPCSSRTRSDKPPAGWGE